MASKNQMTGMLGVYLVAAELSRRGFIVSPTSRSAAGADLLVTDQECQRAWSVQVKTNKKPANFWLVGANANRTSSDSHMYVFVNVGKGDRAEYIVAPSRHVHETSATGSEWYSFARSARLVPGEGWELFGDPHGSTATDETANTTSEGDQA
jgi:hypothetical protein